MVLLKQISHKINKLSFGVEFPGVVNPLDGYVWNLEKLYHISLWSLFSMFLISCVFQCRVDTGAHKWINRNVPILCQGNIFSI